MPTLLVTEITIGGPKVMRKGAKTIIKKAMASSIKFWHREFAPRHFRRGASRKYGYAGRAVDGSAHARLLRASGTSSPDFKPPLVDTGNMRAAVLKAIDIRGSAKRMRGFMRGPVYLSQFPKRRGAPDMAQEIVATIKPELARMLKLVDEQTTRAFKKISTKKVRKIS